jgi:TonB family protein
VGETALGLKSSSQLTIQHPNGSEQTFVPPERDKAFDALNKCQSDLFKAWGYDPHELDQIKTPPKRIGMADWFTDSDYPAEALSKGEHGTTLALYLVGVSGTISDCRVISSSGSVSLDMRTCSTLTKHARYLPATGLSGKPIAAHQIHRAVWRLPD